MDTQVNKLNILSSFEISDIVSIIGIVVNAVLAYWIVKNIQNNLTNKRVLKDHFISEIKNIRLEYIIFFHDLENNKILPREIFPKFKKMNIMINDIMVFLNKIYLIDEYKLDPFIYELPNLITNNQKFINSYNNNDEILISYELQIEILKFQQINNKLFNEIIIIINNSK